jgi:cytochrome c553
MKNLIITAGLALIITGLVSFKSSFTETSIPKVPPPQEASKFTVPDNIKGILDNSCLPCHGTDGNVKAKLKWNYGKTAKMKTHKLVAKLSKIVTKLEKGKMPPPKSVTKYPERKLSDSDKKVLMDWANELAGSLSN